MITEFITAWEKYKSKLEEYIRTHAQSEYDSYELLVKLLFDEVINRELKENNSYGVFDLSDITCLDHGDYQGTQIFILHLDVYQPSISDYVYTSVYYGSCSGCDTLLSINDYSDDFPSERQIECYMTLLLHLLQNCKYMIDSED